MSTLEVDHISIAFGGIQAVQALQLSVIPGEIVSIIGPNGAGKTTVFNIISGFYRPSGGQVRYGGQRIDGLSPERVLMAGIARTFQSLRLFHDLSVLDNVLVSQHHRLGVGWIAATLRTRKYRDLERQMEERAIEALSFFGSRVVGYRLNQPVHVLSYANRRRVEIARAMATGASLLMLDEPAAGMNPNETREIADLILRLRDERNYTILLVEHKMDVIQRVSDRVIAMNFGRKIAEGSYDEVVNNPHVVEAYLGRRRESGEHHEAVEL